MLRRYIDTALHRARYEVLADDGRYYAEVPGLDGVYAEAATLEACRDELESVVEEWLLLRIARQLPIPPLDGIDVQVPVAS
ncbi:MAG: type II toxin-antitoxin system HicB family antitoxin [Trueperaceae bacterium]|nr:type II toxin-antitoxin system HicB family antitoxin [Trueperaceae bacterium]